MTSVPVDPWDIPSTSSHCPPVAQMRTEPIPDDWDNDDDDDEEVEPHKLWQDANSKAPMPELVISSTSTTSTIPPPPAAFQPTLRILKRPAAAAPSPPPSSSEGTQKTYAEREAQYQAARQRIFGQGNTISTPHIDSDGSNTRGGEPSATTQADSQRSAAPVLRQPRGPVESDPENPKRSSSSGKPSRGFGRRKGQSTNGMG
ncbi:hypothetical protein K474DRAFT_1657885 [Panus rudis PR-1116 ss-1]|nr:hypothetical protein K474DRAFT_1657885 [Panus rudis PR-1116 ss-1]